MSFISYAQNFEDIMLWRALAHVQNGFYIDVGASHPDTDSVTRAFYDRGWCGINVEPVRADFSRLAAARIRDINLNIALGEAAGSASLFVVAGTGLSTLETASLPGIARGGFGYDDQQTEIRTLAQICQEHVKGEIHFLKIDVEGGERGVLAGADFIRYRPWILLVEATAPMSTLPTYMEWDHILVSAKYRFVWFDGLNRFYVAQEHWPELAPHFLTPVNVFDDFIRVADTDWAKRINQAEARAAELAARCALAEQRYGAAMARSEKYSEEKHQAVLNAAKLLEQKHQAIQNFEILQGDIASREQALGQMQRELAAVHNSTSWRITWPMRRLTDIIRRAREQKIKPVKPDAEPAILPGNNIATISPPALPAVLPVVPPRLQHGGLKHAVHQFHAGSAAADAITNAMLLTRRVLRAMGYASEIFVLHRDPLLADELRLFEEIPKDDHYVLIVRHSMGFDRFEELVALPASKILIYHNITPVELLAGNPYLQAYSQLGREQLPKLRPFVRAALADSEYNAMELLALGFSPVQTCMLLFDTAELRRRVLPRSKAGVFTILFVGRLIESKGQLDLVMAYLRFREIFDAPSRLILVGKSDTTSAYHTELKALADTDELRSHVIFAGTPDDRALDAIYAEADLYVSLSRHEGFGVPLVEAMANGVPVLAWPCGGVPYTLGQGAVLLMSRAAEAVAAHMLAFAEDPALRAEIVRKQYLSLARFDLENQLPALMSALGNAGAAVPADTRTTALLKSTIRFVVTGHFTTSYSLAAVNRTLALAIETCRPGTVRVLPVPAEQDAMLSQTPSPVHQEILRLAETAKADCGPVIVISQHYPVYIPPEKGDLLLAMFFWEESVIPAETIALLCNNFAGVIAPSRFVAKALVDSGLSIPICQIAYFPDLSRFQQLPPRELPDDTFTFLHVSSCFPRKGVDILLRAYRSAFHSDDKVRLIIKGFPNPHNATGEQIADLKVLRDNVAEIVFINEDMAEPDIAQLYAQADAMVLPTRGEGFNLPAAEALAGGIPLIVTGYGGHMDFCASEKTRLVDYSFARSESHLATDHSVWVEPDVNDLAAAMVEARNAGRRPASATLPANVRLLDFAPRIEAEIEKLEAFSIKTLVTALPQLSIAWVSSWNVRCGIAEYSKFAIENLPVSDRIDRITVLADERTAPESGPVPVVPCWKLQVPESLASLLVALTMSGADIVVIQHQPGLMAWGMLGSLLVSLKEREKIVTVTLHNTQHLLEIGDAERTATLAALENISRVIVHTITDLNRLKKLGLVENVVMIPQGSPTRRVKLSARSLSPADTPVIGCYGFFLPGKGIPELIESLGILNDHWPNARLLLVNANYGDAQSEAEIRLSKEIATNAGLSAFIDWHTQFLPNEETLALLAGCDVIALPYQASKEASSAAMRTALCAGPAVIVTPLAVFEEAGDAVLRFSGLTSGDVAAGLSEVLGDQIGRERSSQRAQIWMSNHSWPIISKRLHGLYLGLAGERGVFSPAEGLPRSRTRPEPVARQIDGLPR